MAKMTIDNVTYEGTAEELREIVRTFEVDEVTEGFAEGDKIRLISGGGDYPLNGFVNGKEYTVSFPEYNHDTGICVQIEKGSGRNGYAKAEQLEKVTESPEDKPAESLTFEGAEYTLVSRKAQEGDVVYVTKDAEGTFAIPNDAKYLVGEYGDIKGFNVYREQYNRTESNVLVYEKLAEESPLKVGDKVEVIDRSNSRYNDLAMGTIGEVTEIRSYYKDTPYRVDTDEDYDRFPAEALRKVAEDTREYKRGDIVSGERALGDGEDIYGTVVSGPDGKGYYGVTSFVDGERRAIIGRTIELVARAKDRVDTK